MNFADCLNDLEKIGLKDLFLTQFNDYITPETEKHKSIYSTASMLRVFISNLETDSIDWVNWCAVLHYLMTPIFCRKEENLLDLQQQASNENYPCKAKQSPRGNRAARFKREPKTN